MNLDLQNAIHDWHLRNYPKDDAESALLGIGEELGELMRAELKQNGGIRGTWDEWQAEKRKEAGDVLIGILNFCGFVGATVKYSPVLLDYCFEEQAKNLTTKMCLLSANLALTKLIQTYADMKYIPSEYTPEERQFPAVFSRDAEQMFLEIGYYCRRSNLDLEEVLNERWQTISQRDFIANPETGGREKEA